MKNKIVNIVIKFFIFLAIVYLFMSVNNADIVYIYANF